MKNNVLIIVSIIMFITELNAKTPNDAIHNSEKNKVTYNANLVFQYGGESKLTLLPKINLFRKHNLKILSCYYGAEIGLHPLFIANSYTFSAVAGVEKNFLLLESSITHFRTSKVRNGESEFSGPFIQNLWNIKMGYQFKSICIKLGASFLINELIPSDDERISLLDIGKINNFIYGIEIQIKIK